MDVPPYMARACTANDGRARALVGSVGGGGEGIRNGEETADAIDRDLTW